MQELTKSLGNVHGVEVTDVTGCFLSAAIIRVFRITMGVMNL